MSSSPLILNVNDQAASRYVTTRQLRSAGFEVIEAENGLSAIALAEERCPGLVVLDVKLPDIDGLEVCRRLRENPATAGIAVLHTSATFITHEMRVLGLDGGADGYLAQPFTAAELVATIRSLLRLKEGEREQRRRAELLAETDRRKDEFLAMLAHELRNPLAAISSAATLLGEEPESLPVVERARDVIVRQTAQLSRLIDDLLDVSRMVRGTIALRRERLDLEDLLRRAIEVARTSKLDQRAQTIDVQLDPGPWPVFGDAARLEQLFMNVLDNAGKFSDSGSTIRVQLRHEMAGEKSLAMVCIRDFGAGVAKDKLAHLFEPFYQANPGLDRSRGGLGIGLSLVRNLTELHNGSVEARSDGEGKGCEIYIRLPLTEDRISTTPAASAPAASQPAAARRILVVDDNEDARSLLVELCERWGHQVIDAADGLTAIELANKEQPDLAFIDIGLPGVDGLEVARRIRQERPENGITLVALTGYGAPHQRDAALAAGFDIHLVKPAPPERLRTIAATAGLDKSKS